MSRVAPAIVLVRPQLGVNIGAVARAMGNFGLSDLRLVSPRDGWPSAEADAMSAGAFLDRVVVRVYEDIGCATSDLRGVLAATARCRRMEIEMTDPETAIGLVSAGLGSWGILFGPESSGLTSADMVCCRVAVRIPVAEDFASLNLAHAVCVLAYVWHRRRHLADCGGSEDVLALATMAEREQMLFQLLEALEERGYFFPSDKAPSMRRALAGSFARTNWTSGDVRRFRGVIAALAR